MKLNIEAFTNTYMPKAVKDCQCNPSAGIGTAVATLRYIRDEMLKEVSNEDKVIITDFFNGEDGIINQVIKAKTLNGFACNASAAAKAAKLEGSAAGLLGLTE